VTVAGAALARAELLIRRGEMSAAAALAQDTVDRLSEGHPDYAWGCNVAGRALHFTSHEEAAFETFQAARQAAKTDEDVKEALWGQFLAITEIAPWQMQDYLKELEERYSDDLDVRLRLAVGRYGTAEQTPSVAGEWSRFAVLMNSVEHSTDPLAATSFLAMASVVARYSANYTLSRDLAERAARMCRELRFDLGLGASLLHRAAAELGLRAFGRAQRSLAAFGQTLISREDPFYRVEGLTVEARLHASRGNLQKALDTHDELTGIVAPPRALGSHLAAHSIVLAASGDAKQARLIANEARCHGSNIEMIHFAALGCAIAEDIDGRSEEFSSRVAGLVIECDQASYVDGLVFAYRVYPRLLTAAQGKPEAATILARLLAKSHDHELARAAGIDIKMDDRACGSSGLTRRECEVLQLLAEGMTNAEIATRLFITPSTAKVHVRHIFAKLGVRTRLQAGLRAQDVLERDEL
jgi:ATP/maltotriose-dependent transcriptional regulator MalT